MVGGGRGWMLEGWGCGVVGRRFGVGVKGVGEGWEVRGFGDYGGKVGNEVNEVILGGLGYGGWDGSEMGEKRNGG